MLNRPHQIQQTNNAFRSIFTEEQQRTADIMILVPNHLTLTIFDPGHGLHPQSGQFIRFKQISYLEKQMKFLKEQTLETPFQRGKLIPALEIVLSFAKQNSRFRVWTSSILAYGETYHENIPIDSSLVFDLHVFSISKIPNRLSSSSEILMLFEEILAQSNEGDQWMKKGKIQQALSSYENAVNKILKSNLKDQIAKLFITEKSQTNQESTKPAILSSSHSIDQQKVTKKFKNTCFKYLELCYSVGEYLKVITIAPKIGKFLSIENHQRILNVLTMTYLQLDEVDLAQKYVQKLKSMKQVTSQTIEKLQKQLFKYKSTMKGQQCGQNQQCEQKSEIKQRNKIQQINQMQKINIQFKGIFDRVE